MVDVQLQTKSPGLAQDRVHPKSKNNSNRKFDMSQVQTSSEEAQPIEPGAKQPMTTSSHPAMKVEAAPKKTSKNPDSDQLLGIDNIIRQVKQFNRTNKRVETRTEDKKPLSVDEQTESDQIVNQIIEGLKEQQPSDQSPALSVPPEKETQKVNEIIEQRKAQQSSDQSPAVSAPPEKTKKSQNVDRTLDPYNGQLSNYTKIIDLETNSSPKEEPKSKERGSVIINLPEDSENK